MGQFSSCGSREPDQKKQQTTKPRSSIPRSSIFAVDLLNNRSAIVKDELERQREVDGSFRDRCDLETRWPASLSCFVTCDLDDTTQTLDLMLSENGPRRLDSVAVPLGGIFKCAVPASAIIACGKDIPDPIVARITTKHLEPIVSRADPSKMTKMLLELVRVNVDSFVIEMHCEQVLVQFDRDEMISAYEAETGDSVDPSAWILETMTFNTSTTCIVHPMPDAVDHYFQMAASGQSKKNVVKAMRADGRTDEEVECFEVRIGSDHGIFDRRYLAITAKSAEKRRFRFHFDEEHIESDLLLEEGLTKLVEVARKQGANWQSMEMCVGSQPVSVCSFESSLYRAKQFSAMGQKDEAHACCIMAADFAVRASQAPKEIQKAPKATKATKAVAPEKEEWSIADANANVLEEPFILNHPLQLSQLKHGVKPSGIISSKVQLDKINILPGDKLCMRFPLDPDSGVPLLQQIADLRLPVELYFTLTRMKEADREFIFAGFKETCDDFHQKLQDGTFTEERYREKLKRICSKMLSFLDNVLIPQATERNYLPNLALYLKTKADYMRYANLCSQYPVSGLDVQQLYEQAMALGRDSLPPKNLTNVSTVVNAAVFEVEMRQDHKTAANLCRNQLVIAHDHEKRAKAKGVIDQDDEREDAQNISEIFNFHLLESNAEVFESSLLLLAVSFDADLIQMIAGAIKEHMVHEETMESEPVKLHDSVLHRDDVHQQRSARGICGVGPCSRQICFEKVDENSEVQFHEHRRSVNDEYMGESASKNASRSHEMESNAYEAAAVEAVRRWLRSHPVQLKITDVRSGSKQNSGVVHGSKQNSSVEHFPVKVRWIDHVEEWTAASDKHQVKQDRNGKSIASLWKVLRDAVKARSIFGKMEFATGPLQTWCMACVCQHPQGKVPEYSANEKDSDCHWKEYVTQAMVAHLKQDDMQSERPLSRFTLHVESDQHKKNLILALNNDGILEKTVHLAGGTVYHGDQLLFEGPLAGHKKYHDLAALHTPLELVFLPSLQAKAIVCTGEGPYAAVHQCFEGFAEYPFLSPTKKFENLHPVRHDLHQIKKTTICKGSTVEHLAIEQRPVGNLSSRRHPKQVLTRGAK